MLLSFTSVPDVSNDFLGIGGREHSSPFQLSASYNHDGRWADRWVCSRKGPLLSASALSAAPGTREPLSQ
eukprot:12398375-Prorocentrum_lima.AAC.1